MEFWKYFNGETDKIYCQARYEVREKEGTGEYQGFVLSNTKKEWPLTKMEKTGPARSVGGSGPLWGAVLNR